jgi:transposase
LSTKIHQLVDGHGLPLVVLLTPGQAGDAPMFEPLMANLRVARPLGRARTRPDALRGDKAYSSRAIRTHLRRRGITAVIPEPDDQAGHRKRRGSRGGRPPKFDPSWLIGLVREPGLHKPNPARIVGSSQSGV